MGERRETLATNNVLEDVIAKENLEANTFRSEKSKGR